MPFLDAYQGTKVLITGHTGFKGSWLSEWLLDLGAEVTGFALPPPTSPALFTQLGLVSRLRHIEGDIRHLPSVQAAVDAAQPSVIFHLAAQSLVRLSYEQPIETYAVNIMGTVNVLEAVRLSGRPCVIVIITTDKCYENREWLHSYRENDAMGGHDPYSSSKGAAELVVSAYRRSYFDHPDSAVRVASVRAGNVVGGGDWAIDRIVPDCMKSLSQGKTIPVRNKRATRPWQHVLEPLSGYLWLGAALAANQNPLLPFPINAYTSAFNFGPALDSNRSVAELVQEILKHWPGQWNDCSDPDAVHEANLLNLAIDKAHHLLKWQPVWHFAQTVAATVAWYRQASTGSSITELTRRQIHAYTETARQSGIQWAD